MGAFLGRMALAMLAAVGVWICGPSRAQGIERPPDDPAVIRWDPAIRHGALANGLRYAVMRNATPNGGVFIRLGIGVGSLDDPDDALGAAHFLEHMAFGGSHAQLQADVEKVFAAAGVAFGRDRNAHTELLSTTYEIDLPHGDPQALDLGFRWLRQVADGAQLTAETVERERGVILAERETRLSDITQAGEASVAFEAPGSRLARGSAVGSRESISGMSAPTLQALYDAWYRPENAVVVVVGDQPLDVLEARVRDSFATWRGRGAAGERPAPAAIDDRRGLDALALSEPNLPGFIGVCRVRAAADDPAYDMASLRREVATDTWVEIAKARLALAVKAPGAGVAIAVTEVSRTPGQAAVACLGGAAADGAWASGLATLGRQAALLSNAQPSEDELEAALKLQRSRLRGALFAVSTRDSSDLAATIVGLMLRKRPSPSPAEAMRAFDTATEGLTPADVQAAFRGDWSGAGPLLIVISPTPLTADKVRQAWAASETGEAQPSTPESSAAWAYSSFGRPGKVVRREAAQDGGYVRLTFANGVRLNFKHTDFESGGVAVRVRFGAGRRELARNDYVTAALGAAIFARGGLGRDTYEDVNRLFAESDLKVEMGLADSAFTLSSRASLSGGLASDLQLLAAYVTDPGFRDLDPLLSAMWQGGLRAVRSYPTLILGETLTDAVAPDNPNSVRAAEAGPQPKGADIARVLRPALTQAPLELTIVGDVSEAQAIAAAAPTFGALPARKVTSRARTDTWFLRFPDPPPATVSGLHDGPAEKAAVALVWPLFVAEPARRREEYALQLAALVYQEALLRRIRGDLGKTYAPTAVTAMPDDADQGYLIASVEASVDDVELVRSEMSATASRIARGEFSDDDLETVRKPLLQHMARETQTNEAWADALQGSSTSDTALTDFEQGQGQIAQISAAEVRKAAADWMAKAPIAVTVTARRATQRAASAASAP